MAKASSKKAPPLMGPLNKQYLAYCFGSTDGTVEGIANKFERARCEARIRFQERHMENWRNDIIKEIVSIDESLSRIHSNHADIERKCADLIRRPLLLRDERASLLKPFPGGDND